MEQLMEQLMEQSEKIDPSKNTLDKTGVLRFDFLFSYWVFGWAIAYYFIPTNTGPISGFIKHNLNPMVAMYVVLVENIINFMILLYYNAKLELIIKFITMIFIIKIIPLYLLRNNTIHLKKDIIGFICIFGLYNAYLFWNNTNIIEIYGRTFHSIIANENNTPFFYWITRVIRVT